MYATQRKYNGVRANMASGGNTRKQRLAMAAQALCFCEQWKTGDYPGVFQCPGRLIQDPYP